jgi:hypothetical protein
MEIKRVRTCNKDEREKLWNSKRSLGYSDRLCFNEVLQQGNESLPMSGLIRQAVEEKKLSNTAAIP